MESNKVKELQKRFKKLLSVIEIDIDKIKILTDNINFEFSEEIITILKTGDPELAYSQLKDDSVEIYSKANIEDAKNHEERNPLHDFIDLFEKR